MHYYQQIDKNENLSNTESSGEQDYSENKLANPEEENLAEPTINLKIINTDTDGTRLEGAAFALYRLNEQGVYESVDKPFTISANGYVIPELTEGDYRIEQLTAVDGYLVVDKETEFSMIVEFDGKPDSELNQESAKGSEEKLAEELVKETDVEFLSLDDSDLSHADLNAVGKDSYQLTIMNPPGAMLPQTGGRGIWIYTLSGLMLVILAALMYGLELGCRERGCK
ncbi:MAG: LPXTG cell wall anchor domain-containing protein [Eubacterium sp.]|nr:LPXTG cell wall anchor domain-containing protein [Eubacterium sp.]